ncbi:MAG: exodeoxyribonuclease VII large subunit [Chromatiales bacterium]|nr:exodeoxyribonuclease VII large subunit [Chromatiales bacterium]
MSDNPSPVKPQRDIYSVSRLNRESRALLEGNFPLLWIEGEISNLSRPRSGHLYFSLKDEFAQVRCAMFRMRVTHLTFVPKDGGQILARVRVSLYENRGDFQLIVDHLEEAGDGLLRRAFDALKQRLLAEGLFEEEHKRPLPTLPRTIGVVTSPSGAAIRDILTVLRRRFPAIHVIIYPVAVQGETAADEIAQAIRLAGRRGECDVLIVGRGGGSLEDLWSFNEEGVARAIYDSPIPVVSAVGHEVDVSISDFVADLRAPTPSAAAELLSPDAEQWQIRLRALEQRLSRAITRPQQQWQRQLLALRARLRHPGQRLQQLSQRLDELEWRLANARRQRVQQKGARLAQLVAHLQRHAPQVQLQRLGTRAATLQGRLHQAMHERLAVSGNRLGLAVRTLEAVSPLATLQRGYAIVTRHDDGMLVEKSNEVNTGDQIRARLAEGELICRVEEKIENA